MNKKYLPLILLIGSVLFLVLISASQMVTEIVEDGSWWGDLAFVLVEIFAGLVACGFMGSLATRESSPEKGIFTELKEQTPLSIRLWQAGYAVCLIVFIYRIQISVSEGLYLDTYTWAWWAIVTLWLCLRAKSFHAWIDRWLN